MASCFLTDRRLDASGKLAQMGETAIHLTHAGGRDAVLFLGLCAADGLELRHAPSGSEIRRCTTVLSRHDRSTTELVEESEAVERRQFPASETFDFAPAAH